MLCSFNKMYMAKLNKLQVWKWLDRFLFSFISAFLSKTNAGLHTTHRRPLMSFPSQITLVCACFPFLLLFWKGLWFWSLTENVSMHIIYFATLSWGAFHSHYEGKKKRLNRCWKIRSAQSGRTITVWAVSQAAIQKQKWAIKCRK